MKKNILVSAAITLSLLFIGSGSFPFSEEKKTDNPAPAKVEQGCPEDDQETLSCSAESSPLFDTAENKASPSNHKPLSAYPN